MNRIGVALSLLLLSLSVCVPGAFCEVIKKPGFSVTLPDGWVEIPSEVLANMHTEMARKAPTAKIPVYDCGFQLKTEQNRMQYPYVLVLVSEIGRLSGHQLKSMPKIDVSAEMSGKAADIKSLMSIESLGRPQYDEAARIIWMTLQADVVGVGKIQGLSGMIPTEKGTVQLIGYALESNFQEYLPIFRGIIKSVIVSPELAYKSRWSDSLPIVGDLDWGQIGRSTLIGAVVGGISYGLIVLLRRRKKRG